MNRPAASVASVRRVTMSNGRLMTSSKWLLGFETATGQCGSPITSVSAAMVDER